MDYTTFQTNLVKEVQRLAGEDFNITLQHMKKNNGVTLNALCIRREEETVAPLIYMDDFYGRYQQGSPISQLAQTLVDQYRETTPNTHISMKEFRDFDTARKRIYCRIVNYELNDDRLLDIPHKRFLDLAITYYYQVEDSILRDATITITNTHFSLWNISMEVLHETAWNNTVEQLPSNLQSMEEALKEMLGEEEQEELTELSDSQSSPVPMYLLSNANRCLGAICMMYPGTLKKAAEYLHSNLFILPSSIHECILVPESRSFPKEELENMVISINATQLEPQELLSNHVYYYDLDEDSIRL